MSTPRKAILRGQVIEVGEEMKRLVGADVFPRPAPTMTASDVKMLIDKHDIPCGPKQSYAASAALKPYIPRARICSGRLELPDWSVLTHWWLETASLRIDPTFGRVNAHEDHIYGKSVIDGVAPDILVSKLRDGSTIAIEAGKFRYSPDDVTVLPCAACGGWSKMCEQSCSFYPEDKPPPAS
jgi:hypothetical protein